MLQSFRKTGRNLGHYLTSGFVRVDMQEEIEATLAEKTTRASQICIFEDKKQQFCTLCTCTFHTCSFRSLSSAIHDVK